MKKFTIKSYNKFMWPVRTVALAYPLYMLGELGNALLALAIILPCIGLIFLLYIWADKYEQKNIKIYLENQALKNKQ